MFGLPGIEYPTTEEMKKITISVIVSILSFLYNNFD